MIVEYECPREGNDCGRMHKGCIGHNRSGGPCGAQPMRATGTAAPPAGRPRCRTHLGRAPEDVQAEYDVEQRAVVLMRRTQELADRHGLTWRDLNPLEELQKTAHEAVQWMAVCRAMISDLNQVRYRAGRAGEQLRAEVGMWERSIDRAARINADIVRLGIEDRIARMNQREVNKLVRCIDGIVYSLGHDPEDPVVASIIGQHLAEFAT